MATATLTSLNAEKRLSWDFSQKILISTSSSEFVKNNLSQISPLDGYVKKLETFSKRIQELSGENSLDNLSHVQKCASKLQNFYVKNKEQGSCKDKGSFFVNSEELFLYATKQYQTSQLINQLNITSSHIPVLINCFKLQKELLTFRDLLRNYDGVEKTVDQQELQKANPIFEEAAKKVGKKQEEFENAIKQKAKDFENILLAKKKDFEKELNNKTNELNIQLSTKETEIQKKLIEKKSEIDKEMEKVLPELQQTAKNNVQERKVPQEKLESAIKEELEKLSNEKRQNLEKAELEIIRKEFLDNIKKEALELLNKTELECLQKEEFDRLKEEEFQKLEGTKEHSKLAKAREAIKNVQLKFNNFEKEYLEIKQKVKTQLEAIGQELSKISKEITDKNNIPYSPEVIKKLETDSEFGYISCNDKAIEKTQELNSEFSKELYLMETDLKRYAKTITEYMINSDSVFDSIISYIAPPNYKRPEKLPLSNGFVSTVKNWFI